MTEVERCERLLRRAILGGEHAAGDRLPPERALAERLEVNRTTLRAALGRLANAGLLRVRQGSGYVVQDYRRHGSLELLADLAELRVERGERPVALISDVLELRRRLAEMALDRIAGREGELDVTPLVAAIDRLEVLADEGAHTEDIAEADLACTAAILGLTGSEAMELLLNPISTVIQRLPLLRETIYRAPHTNVAGYRGLLAWLEARPPQALPLVLAQLRERDEASVALLRNM